MPRRSPRFVAITAAVTLTAVIGAWLLAIGARGFDSTPADANPAPTATVAVDSSHANGSSLTNNAGDDDDTLDQSATDAESDDSHEQDRGQDDGGHELELEHGDQ
jgi:hypothetical protein